MQKRCFAQYITWLFFLITAIVSVHAENRDLITRLKFKQLSTINGLPTNEVRRLYQDKDGYIWIATTSGLCLYDAYQVKYTNRIYTLPICLATTTFAVCLKIMIITCG
ncbi:MAG: two-component regulator propeller domain-containing protein [Bacteroides graminisolvens]